jgi:hypothetical protein
MTANGPPRASRAHQTACPVPHGRSLPGGTLKPAGRSSVPWNTIRTGRIFSYFAMTAAANASLNSLRTTKTTSPNPARIASWTA